MQRLKVDYRIHIVLYALIIILALVLVMSSSRILADAVPGGGGGGSVYTETWTVSTTTTNSSTTNPSETNPSKQKIAVTVDGEDIVISVVIGTTSVIIGRMSNSLTRKKRESDSIMLVSDLDAFTPEMKEQLLKDMKNAIDQRRKDREIDAETLKERLEEFEKLKNSPHFDDAIQILRDLKEDLTLENLQDKVEDLEAKHRELKDLKQCRKCNKPVQATPYKGPSSYDFQWYRGSCGHDWCRLHEDDPSAYDQWRRERNLPTIQTHCKCAYCGTMHRRDEIKPSNGWWNRTFGYGPQFKCQNKACGKEQWVPKTNRWEDETVSVFQR